MNKTQYSIQKLRWIEALIQKDIGENRELLSSGAEDAEKYAPILNLRISNMEALEAKTKSNIAQIIKAQNKARKSRDR